jgi:GDP-4-dehydro-6-deoxy-D-mannose reductase
LRILITGGTGFVGTHLIRFLQTRHSQIFVFSSDQKNTGLAGVQYHKVDIRDREAVRTVVQDVGPDHIYHLAGVTAVESSWKHPHLTYEVNVLGAHNLFDAASNLSVPPKILNVSTSQVYAAASDRLTENSPLFPNNPYAASKAMAEFLTPLYSNQITNGIITARPFNHTGCGQLADFLLPSIAKQFAEIELGLCAPKLRLGNLQVKRDFLDVRDVVRAYSALLENGRPTEIYNVCSGTAVLLSEVIEMFQSISGVDVAVEIDSSKVRMREIPEICGDPRKLQAETGWRREIPLERTVEDLLRWWRSRCQKQNLAVGVD